MLSWMVYVLSVSVLLSAAAFAAEYGARLRRAPSRWLWISAIVASLLLPTVIASVSFQVPNVSGPTASQTMIVLREVTSARLSPTDWVGAGPAQRASRRSLDPLLRQGWVVVSASMVAALLASGVYLFRRKRYWRTGSLAGTSVYIAEDLGPAVVGLLRPRIVVPTWLMESPVAQQRAVIAHEQSHLEAGDPRLLTIALCLLVFMPWNLALWWQLRRLRYAIEVDCDARVLSGGHDLKNYGETLLEVGRRKSEYIGAVAAMSESQSFLEERIQIMKNAPKKWWRLSAAAFGGLSLALVVVAAEVSPPNAGSASVGEHRQIALASSVLDNYVGDYQFSEYTVLKITRKDQQLSAQLTKQPAAPIYPESETVFFYKVVDAQISFESIGQGPALALVLHQNGVDRRAPRIDAMVAQQIAAALTARVQSQTPLPGSEAAVHRLIAGVANGKPNYEEMTPELAEGVRKEMPKLQSGLKKLGPVVSVQFVGVGNYGWDVYQLKHEHGTSHVRIMMNSQGIITGALSTEGL